MRPLAGERPVEEACTRSSISLLGEIAEGATNPSAEVPAGGCQIYVEDPSRGRATGPGVDVAKASRGLRGRSWPPEDWMPGKASDNPGSSTRAETVSSDYLLRYPGLSPF